MIRIFLTLFTLIYCSLALAGTIDPKNSDQQHIEYGKKHECVLRIMGIMGDQLNSFFRGSCVLIDENYAITAAHVVVDSISQHIVYKGKAYPAEIIAVHALFDKKIGKHDIAVIKLQRPIRLDFYPSLYTGRDEVSKVCSISGFGFYGNFNKGSSHKNFDNKRRAGSNIISAIEKNLLICSTADSPQTTLEFLITSGDSGGGLFIDNKLAGINSCVFAKDGNANSDYGDTSGHTRISDYHIWIKNTISTIEKISN